MKQFWVVSVLKPVVVASCASLMIASMTYTAVGQGTRSSVNANDPLLAIAAGIDPLTGQQANLPFTAPTSLEGTPGAFPPLVSLTNAQPIFISDAELMGTGMSDFVTPGANMGGLMMAQNVSTMGIDNPTGASGASSTIFISDTELFNATSQMVNTSSFGMDNDFFTTAAVPGMDYFGVTDAIGERLPGSLPIVGPEYVNEIPGMGLSVVQAIPSITGQQAQSIATGISNNTGNYNASNMGASDLGTIPAYLLVSKTRPSQTPPYISGKLAAVSLGIVEAISNNPIAQPNPVSSIKPKTSTDNLNAPISEDGTPQSLTTIRVDEERKIAAAESAEVETADVSDPAIPPLQEEQTEKKCSGPLVLQFSDDRTSLETSHKQRLRAIISACRVERPDAVYRVVGYSDASKGSVAAARRTPGSRLFDLRFFMVESGVSAQDLDLSTDFESGDFDNALVVNIDS